MRLLFFIDNLGYGGKERRLLELLKGLSKNTNIQLDLVLAKNEIVYNEIFDIKVKIHFATRKNFKKDPRVFIKFFRLVKRIKPDIIHVWGNLEAIYSLPTKLLLNIPMINSQIANAYDHFPRLLNHNLTFPWSNLIIANSYAGLEAYNAPEHKSKVIYNGFDFKRLDKLKEKNELSKTIGVKTSFVAGMVASFAERKDYTTFMKAINMVIDQNPDISFLCIGDGDYKPYQNMLDKKSAEHVLFFEHQQDVESIMNICDIGVLATYTEGISNSILEFMALGKPVIVAGGGGCVELVENKVNGFVLESGDYTGIAERILFFMNNSIELTLYGIESKKIVNNKFSMEKMIESFKNEYERLLTN
jgi:glycosyltransferase involved in cell wall biosynthesis